MTRNSQRIIKTLLASTALMFLMMPYLLRLSAWYRPDRTKSSTPAITSAADSATQCSPVVEGTDNSPLPVIEVNTIQETAEQCKPTLINKVNDKLLIAILNRNSVCSTDNESYSGMTIWGGSDIFDDLYDNFYQYLCMWARTFISRDWKSS